MKMQLCLSRNDAALVGERGRLDRFRRRPADDLAAFDVARQGGVCSTNCSARRRTERPGRSRSPFPTATFRLRRLGGFTLIEIMVVVIILGILAATIIPQFIGTTHDAKVSTAKSNIAELESALERFYIHLDRYPTPDEGLKVHVDPPTGDEKK